MHPFISKTFGGLSRQYYFRQLFFGMLFPTCTALMLSRGANPVAGSIWFFFVVNTLLYPYSRFVYEGIMNFIVGNNVFVFNAFVMMFVKLLTMLLCWGFAVFVAPVGLAYLYYRHSKAATQG